MNVTPPAAWGMITGTVTTASGKPLAGATVQIVTRGGKEPAVYTLTTSANGSYCWWLDDRYNPLQVTVTDSGHTAQTKPASITAGGTTTLNFALKKT